jgi:hypothetical protein
MIGSNHMMMNHIPMIGGHDGAAGDGDIGDGDGDGDG